MTDFQTLAKTTYMSIESYRRDGTRVRTPVWLTTHAGKLHCWTQANSGKVKRIRNNPRVRLAICDASGRVQGDWVEATGKVLDSSDAVKA